MQTDVSMATYGQALQRNVIVPTASPWVYQNTSSRPQTLVLSGGVVTTISISRDGTNYDLVGLLTGQFDLQPWDFLKVAYVTVPVVAVYQN